MEIIKVKIKTLDNMIKEFGSDYLGTLTTPQFNVFMESLIPKDRIVNVAKLEKHENMYLIGTLYGKPYIISNQQIQEYL